MISRRGSVSFSYLRLPDTKAWLMDLILISYDLTHVGRITLGSFLYYVNLTGFGIHVSIGYGINRRVCRRQNVL